MVGYKVISPTQSHSEIRRTYEDLAEAHMQWLISENPDDHNNSQVVFCRSCDFPQADQGLGYPSQTAVMVGDRSLNILDSQYIFMPIIFTCATDREHNAPNVQDRSQIAWRDTMEGDYPPGQQQILIDGNSLELDGSKMMDFLICTRDFTLRVPNVAYGRSLKDFLDIPMSAPGDRQAITVGFFLLFKFQPHISGPETHSLKWEAFGVDSPQSRYTAHGAYTINVSPSVSGFMKQKERVVKGISSVFTERLDALLESRKQKGQISSTEYDKLKGKSLSNQDAEQQMNIQRKKK